MVRAFFLISLFFIFLSCGDSSKNATDSSGSGSNVDGQIKTGNSGSNTANSGNSGGQKCLPKCSGKECGDDGCGKSCGQCSKDKNCKNGQCLPNTSSCQNPKKTAQISEISLKPQSPAGKYQKIKNGKFTDHFIYNSSGTIKVGVREDWGASIIFFGIDQGKNGNENTNVIDSNDPGREVQVAFYDAKRIKQGCSYNSSCLQPGANQCKNSISYLGWNPVQGGNRCNEGSPVKSISFNKGKLEAMVEPLHWNPDWQRNDCQIDGCNHANKKRLKSDILYKQKLSFVGERTVMMEMEIKNLSNTN